MLKDVRADIAAHTEDIFVRYNYYLTDLQDILNFKKKEAADESDSFARELDHVYTTYYREIWVSILHGRLPCGAES